MDGGHSSVHRYDPHRGSSSLRGTLDRGSAERGTLEGDEARRLPLLAAEHGSGLSGEAEPEGEAGACSQPGLQPPPESAGLRSSRVSWQ